MTWSLATPTWVAPSSSSASVDRSTPIVAAYGPRVVAHHPPEVLAEQLVGAVDEMDLHCGEPGAASSSAPSSSSARPWSRAVVGAPSSARRSSSPASRGLGRRSVALISAMSSTRRRPRSRRRTATTPSEAGVDRPSACAAGRRRRRRSGPRGSACTTWSPSSETTWYVNDHSPVVRVVDRRRRRAGRSRSSIGVEPRLLRPRRAVGARAGRGDHPVAPVQRDAEHELRRVRRRPRSRRR